MRLFDPLYGTTRGGLETELLDWMIYRVSFVFFDIGQGAAYALFALYLTLIVGALMFKQLIKAMSITSGAEFPDQLPALDSWVTDKI